MPLHLFCLLAKGAEVAPPARIPAIVQLETDDLLAWASFTDEARVSREGRKLGMRTLEHDQIIAEALAQGPTPMPATLSDPYPNAASLLADVHARADEIHATLARIKGTVEMAVIITSRSSELAAAAAVESPGRAYLERLRDLPSALSGYGDAIEGRVGRFSLASSRRPDAGRLGLSHLVRRNDVEAYRSAALDGISPAIRLVVDGPRAPYSFAAFSPHP
ncbi:MAG TPA: GvpL/GvpF family gas vesicle protein [Gemmatimonadaceae bacterium]